jgi:predicted ATP-grasp superfamily ATP-dependent carboligase
MAESAARAGYTVLAVDAFGDLDHPGAPALSLARDLGLRYTALAAARASRALVCDAVCYVSNFENHPRALALLAKGRALWGNPPHVLERARDPLYLARLLRARGFVTPRVRATAPAPVLAESPPHRATGSAAADPRSPALWLSKPRASGGGHGVTPWPPRPGSGRALPRTRFLQERILGPVGSIAFVSDGQRALPFALSRQLVGDPAFGASGYRYCGSILAPDALAPVTQLPAILERATELAQALTEELALVGLNCLDFVLRCDTRSRPAAPIAPTPYPIELNPRHSASMELAERAYGYSVFTAHALACQRAPLPPFDLARTLATDARAIGKAILFAPRTVMMPDTRPWLSDPCISDIPHPGELIPRGRPICTIFAEGRDTAECYAGLVRRARKLYEEIEK